MCLGVPGRVVEWVDRDPTFAKANVEFGGVSRICSMACVPNAAIGDYVVVHAGIAISRIDETSAQQALSELEAWGLDKELADMQRDVSQADEAEA